MRVLVIGSGGREHALVWRLGADASVDQIVCAPGNPGIAALCETGRSRSPTLTGSSGLARERAVDLTVVGPEAPLADGLADRLQAGGLAVLRALPRRRPPRDEQDLRERLHGPALHFDRRPIVPARPGTTPSRPSHELGGTVVIKADGLAAGKGVVVADDAAAAIAAIDAAMVDGAFGAAGARVVVEEWLVGEEASFFALCDGDRALTLGSAQDHKRVFDDDDGPNTGGMGAFAPSPLVTPQLESRILRRHRRPGADGHARRGGALSRLSLCRPDADGRGPEGDRVQRQIRRSRSAGRPAGSRGRSRVALRWPRHGAVLAICRARQPAGRTSGWCSRRTAIPEPSSAARRSRA